MHASFLDSRSAITDFLYLKDPAQPVDLCFVLGCPTVWNMEPAIDLYERGYTPKIVISGHGPMPDSANESDSFKAFALERGVPENAILLERSARNTLENFVFSRKLIEEEIGWQRLQTIAIVGKPFHMRRALMTARQQWPDHLRFVMLPTTDPRDEPADTWWQSESGRRWVMAELRAIGEYAMQGHLGGF